MEVPNTLLIISSVHNLNGRGWFYNNPAKGPAALPGIQGM